MSERFEVYTDKAGKTRWRFVSPGDIIADSGQGYANFADAVRGMEIVAGGQWYADQEKVLSLALDTADLPLRIGSVNRTVYGVAQDIPVVRVEGPSDD
jgi:uncharacterized protein YegP (UPF0339 family)